VFLQLCECCPKLAYLDSRRKLQITHSPPHIVITSLSNPATVLDKLSRLEMVVVLKQYSYYPVTAFMRVKYFSNISRFNYLSHFISTE